MRKNSIKNTRITGEVRRELSNIILNEIKDPRICPMTSVVEVEVAPDLKTAKAYISVLATSRPRQIPWRGLKSAEGYIRRALAKSINLRNTRRSALSWTSPSSTVSICQSSLTT